MAIQTLIKWIMGAIVLVIVIAGSMSLWKYVAPLAKVDYKELPAAQKSMMDTSFNGFIQRVEECLAKKNTQICICKDLMLRLPVDLKKNAKINITQNIKNSEIQLLYNDKPTELKKSVEFVHFSYITSGDAMPRTKDLAVINSIIDLNKNEITVYYNPGKISDVSAEIISAHAVKVPQSTSFISFTAKRGLDTEKQVASFESLPEC